MTKHVSFVHKNRRGEHTYLSMYLSGAGKRLWREKFSEGVKTCSKTCLYPIDFYVFNQFSK